jgi:hypothetical protein
MSEPMTRKQAFTRRAELLKDTGWTARYLARGAAERRELRHLNALVMGEPSPTETSREEAEARRKELLADPTFRQLYSAGDATARAEMAGLHIILASAVGE